MKRFMSRGCAALIAAASFSMVPAAHAQDTSALPFDPERPWSGIVREGDVPALFDYLREAWAGAMEGRSVPVPEDLQRRADAIGAEVRGRAAAGGLLLLNTLERNLSELLRERPEPPRPRTPGAI